MIWALIVIIALFALFCFAASADSEECPRKLLGYRCRGDECDHSFIELQRAKDARERRYW